MKPVSIPLLIVAFTTGCMTKRQPASFTAVKPPDAIPQRAEPADHWETKLDSVLLQIVRAQKASGLSGAMSVAKKKQVELRAQMVKLDITAESKDVSALLIEKVKAAGGEVQSSLLNKIYAFLPVERIEQLAKLPQVYQVSVTRATSSE